MEALVTDLEEKVAQSLTRYNMLTAGDGVGVAVSGGADSSALLHILRRLDLFQITVLHVNHHLRGAESDADEQFVRELAATLRLPIEVRQGAPDSGNVEQNARDLRRAFFKEARERLHLRCVALGHNQTDQAETVLYRFIRGSGLSGLAGMRRVTTDHFIRPMLDATREEIRGWAAANQIEWREDSSNQDLDFVRNRLRLEVINPQLVGVLSATAGVAQDEEEWWAGRMDETFADMARTIPLGLLLPLERVNALHAAEQRRLIRHAIRYIKGDLRSIDLPHVEAVRKLLQSEAGHDRILLPGVDILRSFRTLLLALPGKLGSEPRHYRIIPKIGTEMALPYDNGRLYVNWVKLENQFCGNFGVEPRSIDEVFDLDGEVLNQVGTLDSLQVRNWEPGDEYRRIGHEKSEKIKALFQEYRIVLWERRRWPVMVLNEQIVWSKRFGAAARFQATDASRNIVRILYTSGVGSVAV